MKRILLFILCTILVPACSEDNFVGGVAGDKKDSSDARASEGFPTGEEVEFQGDGGDGSNGSGNIGDMNFGGSGSGDGANLAKDGCGRLISDLPTPSLNFSSSDYFSLTSAEGTTVNLKSTSGLQECDEIMLTSNTSGQYEFATVDKIVDGTSITLKRALSKSFSSAYVIKVKQFVNLDLTTTMTTSNSHMAVVVHGTLSLKAGGGMNVDGKGSHGGAPHPGNYVLISAGNAGGGKGAGREGMGPAGPPLADGRACNPGMGNTPWNGHCHQSIAIGGGGGGYGTQGQSAPGARGFEGRTLGFGGGTYGSSSAVFGESFFVGSGGGGGGAQGYRGMTGGAGGKGGGAIFVRANNILAQGGTISAKGANGGAATLSGGGGSGGTVILQLSNPAQCQGGFAQIAGGQAGSGTGGNGGEGRLICLPQQ